jgi:hypothetical protein
MGVKVTIPWEPINRPYPTDPPARKSFVQSSAYNGTKGAGAPSCWKATNR